MENKIKESLNIIPEAPGVYFFYGTEKKIIYVGKAKNLNKRVKSYFQKEPDSTKTALMIPQVNKFEFIVTNSEMEAFILESHMIKKHQPKYNILLKDDKRFPWFVITNEEYPKIVIKRKVENKEKGEKYFGPYTNARAMYATLELMKSIFPLKQCKKPKFKDRPCIYFQMGKCSAPCQKKISSENYKKIVEQVEMFLSGKQLELLKAIKKQMEKHSANQEYEKAARCRDSYADVISTMEKQKVISSNTNINQDIIGVSSDDFAVSIALLKIREGRLISKDNFGIKKDGLYSEREAINAFIRDYYGIINENDIPKEIIIPQHVFDKTENGFNDKDIIAEWLSLKKKGKISITTPKQGAKTELVEMASKNADAYLEEIRLEELKAIMNDWNEIGSYIQKRFNLLNFPERVECFDVSHIQGTNKTASMSVFINGKSVKSEYRKYKIKTLEEGINDDFLAIEEIIKRRSQKILKDKEIPQNPVKENIKNVPDLIIIDGGKGQLSSALKAAQEEGLKDIPIISLAKKNEEIFVQSNKTPIILPANSPVLFFFQRIRDEAHRFAVSYHKKLREKEFLARKDL